MFKRGFLDRKQPAKSSLDRQSQANEVVKRPEKGSLAAGPPLSVHPSSPTPILQGVKERNVGNGPSEFKQTEPSLRPSGRSNEDIPEPSDGHRKVSRFKQQRRAA